MMYWMIVSQFSIPVLSQVFIPLSVHPYWFLRGFSTTIIFVAFLTTIKLVFHAGVVFHLWCYCVWCLSNPEVYSRNCTVQSGAAAGLCVDIVLFPLDTLKTRLQSTQGFVRAGGFHGIYRGIGSTAVGSVPGGRSGRFIISPEFTVMHGNPSESYRTLIFLLGHINVKLYR